MQSMDYVIFEPEEDRLLGGPFTSVEEAYRKAERLHKVSGNSYIIMQVVGRVGEENAL